MHVIEAEQVSKPWPTIVLADEPTANLDHATAAGVLATMKKMRDEQALDDLR
jgi:ABC-type lipoprotein export system ATPase subunit